MKKKISAIVSAILLAVVAVYCLAPGFLKQGSTCITGFSVSEDGTQMAVTVMVTASMGYVRKVSENRQYDGTLYLDCYAAFGGINGSWGAKKVYTIQLREDTKRIALYNFDGYYKTVLEKNEDGKWQYASV